MKPTLHSHLKEPSVFMHTPSSSQLWVFTSHSSISWKKQNIKNKWVIARLPAAKNCYALSCSCRWSTEKKRKVLKKSIYTYTGHSISCVNRNTRADERSVGVCTASIYMTVMLVFQFSSLTFVDIWKTQNITLFYLISELFKQDEHCRDFKYVDEARASFYLGFKGLCISIMVRWLRFGVGRRQTLALQVRSPITETESYLPPYPSKF